MWTLQNSKYCTIGAIERQFYSELLAICGGDGKWCLGGGWLLDPVQDAGHGATAGTGCWLPEVSAESMTMRLIAASSVSMIAQAHNFAFRASLPPANRRDAGREVSLSSAWSVNDRTG